MPRELVPELHDAGKLVDTVALAHLGLEPGKHCFEGLDFSKLGLAEPDGLTWAGIRYHHDVSWNNLPPSSPSMSPAERENRWLVFLLKLADHHAASVGRAGYETAPRGQTSPHVVRLWNTEFAAGQNVPPISTEGDLLALLETISTDYDAAHFFEEYAKHLDAVPESKEPPRNITTLRAHLELVGKIFRFLKERAQKVEGQGAMMGLYGGGQAASVDAAEGPKPFRDAPGAGAWRLTLLKISLIVPHTIARLQDLNILAKRSQLLQELVRTHPDQVLLHTSESALLLVDGDEGGKLLDPFARSDIQVDVTEIVADLGLLNSDLDDRFQEFKNFYRSPAAAEVPQLELQCVSFRGQIEEIEKQLPAPSADRPALGKRRAALSRSLNEAEGRIAGLRKAADRFSVTQTRFAATLQPGPVLDLCPVCQLHPPSSDPWMKGPFVEFLCSNCKAVRELRDPDAGARFARWDDLGVSAGWLKLSLNTKQRTRAVRELFHDYVHCDRLFQGLTPEDKEQLDRSLRPLAVEVDFTNDYLGLLAGFRRGLCNVGEELPDPVLQPIPDYLELYIVQMPDTAALFRLLDLFLQCLRERFPVYAGEDARRGCPVHFSISLSNTKFPFNAHWRNISGSEMPVNIHLPSRGIRLGLEVRDFLRLKRAIYDDQAGATSSFLHRLAEFEGAGTPLSAELALLQNRQRFPGIFELYCSGIATIRQIVNFHRVAAD